MIKMLHPKAYEALAQIKEENNQSFGFHEGIPRINYGPCGVFAKLFYDKWNALFSDKCHICFILTHTQDECDHVAIRLPSGELYDGGVGVHDENEHIPKFMIENMLNYDEQLLDKWSYGLDRTHQRFCPNFDRALVENIISTKLEALFKSIGSSAQ
nr:Unknown Function [uncultured bacterium]